MTSHAYNPELAMERRRHAGIASRAAYRGGGSRSEIGFLTLEPCDDPNAALWQRRAQVQREALNVRIGNDAYEALTTALPDDVDDMTWLQIYRGWQAVARMIDNDQNVPSAIMMLAAWTEAAREAADE